MRLHICLGFKDFRFGWKQTIRLVRSIQTVVNFVAQRGAFSDPVGPDAVYKSEMPL
jgi:hypothetical protein